MAASRYEDWCEGQRQPASTHTTPLPVRVFSESKVKGIYALAVAGKLPDADAEAADADEDADS